MSRVEKCICAAILVALAAPLPAAAAGAGGYSFADGGRCAEGYGTLEDGRFFDVYACDNTAASASLPGLPSQGGYSFGCVSICTDDGCEWGCLDPLPVGAFQMSPLLTDGRMTFCVQSSGDDQICADVVLTGEGDSQDNRTISPGDTVDPGEASASITFDGTANSYRAAIPSGSVTFGTFGGEVLPGGYGYLAYGVYGSAFVTGYGRSLHPAPSSALALLTAIGVFGLGAIGLRSSRRD